ncbi:MAG TPA: Fic family protein [Capsulimonadaceae bacterium]|nr:Fic family protein [Capsulimonadaceae bacterium]
MNKRTMQGEWRVNHSPTESFKAFVPFDLPPRPSLQIDGPMQDLIEQANRALGRLDGIAMLLPDRPLFLYFYVRKEAVLSSQIEGTQSSLSDLLLFENHEIPGVPVDDVQEVSNYVAALNHGLKRLRDDDFPLSSRLIKELHRILLSSGRGSHFTPGEFRTTQNWIQGSRPGNALYVPPPPDVVPEKIGALDKFIHDETQRTPALIKAALAHVQFETIHPFHDGNGRIGRLLIPLLLVSEGALQEPLLYLSLYFKTNKQRYYDLLQGVRFHGQWEDWLAFFLEGVRDTADTAALTAQRILQLFEHDIRKIEILGRGAGTAIRIHQLLQKHPVFTVRTVMDALGLTHQGASKTLKKLIALGIIAEPVKKSRAHLFGYKEYLRILSEGTEISSA